MKIHRLFSFLFTSISTGLAAAFLLVLFRPELITEQRPSPAPVQKQDPTVAVPGPYSYADAVEVAAPAVVNIFATKFTRERPTTGITDPILEYLFGRQQQKPRLKKENSLGSGVVVDPNGFILTNHHVIEGASEIQVVISDNQSVPARLVGSDPDTDLALLQAGGKDMPTAMLGDSDRLRVGDVVLAIGNPFSVGQTITQGIVSATGRHRLGITQYENFIQTDAAINPGNSGGALINARGEVIGINTAIFSKSGGSQGIGFAIPINLARSVMKQLLAHGRVIRGWIGISGQDLTPALAAALEIDKPGGVLVSAVLEQGPADQAGVQPGDVIREIDGEAVIGTHQTLYLIANKEPGSDISLVVERSDGRHELTAKAQERPATSE